MEVTIEDVRKFLTANREVEEVLALVKEFAPEPEPVEITSEQVQEFLQTESGQALLQPMMDSRVTDAIKTYKSGHFDKEVRAAVAAEMLKINPVETPEQRRIRELEEKDAQRDAEMAERDLQGNIEKMAFKSGIDPEYIEGLHFNSIEEFALYAKRFNEKLEAVKTAAANELLASGYQPGSGDGAGNANPQKVELAKLTPEEMVRLEESGELDAILSQ